MADVNNRWDPVYSGDTEGRYFWNGSEWGLNPSHPESAAILNARSGGGGGKNFWEDPSSAWTRDWANAGKAMDDVGKALGYVPNQVDPNAPGGTLDTSQADADRQRLAPLLFALQQQAATGGGAWEGTLADATRRAADSATAIGQSQRGVDYQTALMNIGRAQGTAKQRAAGQDNVLRAKSKAGAQDQLASLTGAMGDDAAKQSAAEAAALQGITELNSTLQSNANKQMSKDTQGAGGMMMGAFSKGGEVPGRAKVPGNDSRNDTVPTLLSPGEIVIPISHADSPESAADFVRALQRREPQQMADGGYAGNGLSGPNPNSADTARAREAGAVSIFLPHVGSAMRQTKQQAPSIENGGLLNTQPYNQARDASLANADMIAQRARGQDAALAQQHIQDSVDANIGAALADRGRGGISAGDALARTVNATQGSAGNAAATMAGEQSGAQQQLSRALMGQADRDLAFAQAQQQAAFRQTLMNAGIGLEQQAAMRGLLSGAGQAAMAGSDAFGRRDSSYDLNDKNTPMFDEGLDDSEWSNPYEGGGDSSYSYSGPADLHGYGDEKWAGGRVGYAEGGRVEAQKASDFVSALKRRRAQ